MEFRKRKNDLLTLPNGISLIRILLIPVYISIYMKAKSPGEYLTAGSVLAFSCITDCLDGWIARRFSMISLTGKILDPLADKLTQLSLLFCLSYRYRTLIPLLLLLLIKEGVQLIACLISLKNGKILPGALPAGKICTAILFVSLIPLIAFPHIPEIVITAVVWIDTIFLINALSAYLAAYFFPDNG